MNKKIPTLTKIEILLEGEIENYQTKTIEKWFLESFEWIEENERYKLGSKLIDAKLRWEKLNLKNI